jgi:hypothetical protein
MSDCVSLFFQIHVLPSAQLLISPQVRMKMYITAGKNLSTNLWKIEFQVRVTDECFRKMYLKRNEAPGAECMLRQ